MPAVLNPEHKLPRPDNPDILDSIRADLQRGIPLRYAATRAGIHEDTAYHWKTAGKAEPGSPAGVFVRMLKEADAECVSNQLEEWMAEGSNWVKHATLLERRFPKDFGRNQQITVDATVTYVHELGPGAEAAILARREELESLQGGTETDTGGLPALPAAQQPDAPHTAENQP